jgi:hypothetical protein
MAVARHLPSPGLGLGASHFGPVSQAEKRANFWSKVGKYPKGGDSRQRVLGNRRHIFLSTNFCASSHFSALRACGTALEALY